MNVSNIPASVVRSGGCGGCCCLNESRLRLDQQSIVYLFYLNFIYKWAKIKKIISMKYFFLFFSNRSKVLKTNFKFIQRTNTKLYKIRKFTFRFEAFSFRLGASTGAATTTNNNNNKQQQQTTRRRFSLWISLKCFRNSIICSTRAATNSLKRHFKRPCLPLNSFLSKVRTALWVAVVFGKGK